MMKKRVLCIASALVLGLLFTTNAPAVDVRLKKGASQKVCGFIFKGVKASLKTGLPVRFQFLPPLHWQNVSYTFKNIAGEFHIIDGRVADIDIDNDGNEESVLIESTSLRWQNMEFLFVFPKGKAPSSQSTVVASDELSKWKGIYSFIPWPYFDKDLFGIEIYPFVFDSVTYIVLMDVHFARGMQRPLLVVKYRGRELVHEGDRLTDDFETVCRIQ